MGPSKHFSGSNSGDGAIGSAQREAVRVYPDLDLTDARGKRMLGGEEEEKEEKMSFGDEYASDEEALLSEYEEAAASSVVRPPIAAVPAALAPIPPLHRSAGDRIESAFARVRLRLLKVFWREPWATEVASILRHKKAGGHDDENRTFERQRALNPWRSLQSTLAYFFTPSAVSAIQEAEKRIQKDVSDLDNMANLSENEKHILTALKSIAKYGFHYIKWLFCSAPLITLVALYGQLFALAWIEFLALLNFTLGETVLKYAHTGFRRMHWAIPLTLSLLAAWFLPLLISTAIATVTSTIFMWLVPSWLVGGWIVGSIAYIGSWIAALIGWGIGCGIALHMAAYAMRPEVPELLYLVFHPTQLVENVIGTMLDMVARYTEKYNPDDQSDYQKDRKDFLKKYEDLIRFAFGIGIGVNFFKDIEKEVRPAKKLTKPQKFSLSYAAEYVVHGVQEGLGWILDGWAKRTSSWEAIAAYEAEHKKWQEKFEAERPAREAERQARIARHGYDYYSELDSSMSAQYHEVQRTLTRSLQDRAQKTLQTLIPDLEKLCGVTLPLALQSNDYGDFTVTIKSTAQSWWQALKAMEAASVGPADSTGFKAQLFSTVMGWLRAAGSSVLAKEVVDIIQEELAAEPAVDEPIYQRNFTLEAAATVIDIETVRQLLTVFKQSEREYLQSTRGQWVGESGWFGALRSTIEGLKQARLSRVAVSQQGVAQFLKELSNLEMQRDQSLNLFGVGGGFVLDNLKKVLTDKVTAAYIALEPDFVAAQEKTRALHAFYQQKRARYIELHQSLDDWVELRGAFSGFNLLERMYAADGAVETAYLSTPQAKASLALAVDVVISPVFRERTKILFPTFPLDEHLAAHDQVTKENIEFFLEQQLWLQRRIDMLDKLIVLNEKHSGEVKALPLEVQPVYAEILATLRDTLFGQIVAKGGDWIARLAGFKTPRTVFADMQASELQLYRLCARREKTAQLEALPLNAYVDALGRPVTMAASAPVRKSTSAALIFRLPCPYIDSKAVEKAREARKKSVAALIAPSLL